MKKENETPPADVRDPKRSKNEQVEAYFSKRYAFRFNTVKCKPEYRAKDGTLPFVPVTKFALNSFKRELDKELGLSTSARSHLGVIYSQAKSTHKTKTY